MAIRSFRYRFYPNKDQEVLLRKTFGCVRLVYNKALYERNEAWISARKSVKYTEQDKNLTAWKRTEELSFLNEVSCVPLQQALRHLQVAFNKFFKKLVGYPCFKKKHNGGSATFTRGAFKIIGEKLKLAKMAEHLDIRWSRPLPEGISPSTVTVTLDASNRWHIAIQLDDTNVKDLEINDEAIGIDLGIEKLATISTGEKIRNLRLLSKESKNEKKLARSLSRKKKGSNNRKKARLKLARFYAKIADRRNDYIHKLSTRLVRENQVIVVENLNIRGMMKNRSLAKAINDAGWSTLVPFLRYKCKWYGRFFIRIDRFYPSSKTCSNCGHVLRKLSLSVREWVCPKCNSEHDRDINAARNILAAGHAVTACGPDVRQCILRNVVQLGMKQELMAVRPGTVD